MEDNENITVKKYGIKQTLSKAETGLEYGGISDKIMGTVNGEKVMIKGDNNKEPLAEYFAYKLGILLGLNVNKVKLIDCGDLLGLSKVCSVHWWEEGFKRARDLKCEVKTFEKMSRDLFDAIINNDDRHDSNWGVVEEKMFLIDHGLSYPWRDFDSDDWAYKITKAISNPDCNLIVEKFLLLKEVDFRDLLSLPQDFEYDFSELIEEIIDRMNQVQRWINKNYCNKVEAIA